MSKWDEMNEENPAEGEESVGLQNLRKSFDKKKKENEDLKAKLAQLELRERERTLSETLSAQGLNPKLAKFYPASQETTQENVDKWLEENADVFGLAKAPTPPAAPQVSEELRRTYEQFAQPGMNTPSQDEVSAIRNYQFDNGDPDAVQKFMAFMRNHPGAVQNPGV